MLGILLQDWVTIRGQATSARTVIQSQPSWLDLAGFRDVIAWLDVREVNIDAGSVNLTYQTAPIQDEALFAAMAGPFAINTGVTITQMIAPVSNTPLSRYFRWVLAPSAAPPTNPWDVTFRILIAVNQPGSARSGVAALSAEKASGSKGLGPKGSGPSGSKGLGPKGKPPAGPTDTLYYGENLSNPKLPPWITPKRGS